MPTSNGGPTVTCTCASWRPARPTRPTGCAWPRGPAQGGFTEDQLKLLVELSQAFGGHPRNHLVHSQSSFRSETEFLDTLALAFNSLVVKAIVDFWHAKKDNTKLEMTVSMKDG